MLDITYRTTGPWGIGQGSDLSASQIDFNFYDVVLAIQQIQSDIPLVEIAYFEVVGDVFYVVFSDHSVLGPYQLPEWIPNFVGEWQPNTAYNVRDSFWYNGLAYIVIFQGYTGAATFNPFANDGLGHNFFSAPILGCAGNMLPNNGQPGQILVATVNQGVGNPPLVAWENPELTSLFDVALSSPLDTGDVLHWTGTIWSNGHVSTLGLSVEDLSDYVASSPKDTGQVLLWTGTDWTNGDPKLENLSDYSQQGTLSIGAPLFYDGSGWANSQIGLINSLAGHDTLQWDSITGTWTNTAVGAFFLVSGIATNQVLQYNGSNWINVNPADAVSAASALSATTGTVAIDTTLSQVYTVTPTGSITLNATTTSPNGGKFTLVITTSGTSSFNITPSSNFKSTGALATGVVSGKVFTISFASDGVNWNETGRTTAM